MYTRCDAYGCLISFLRISKNDNKYDNILTCYLLQHKVDTAFRATISAF